MFIASSNQILGTGGSIYVFDIEDTEEEIAVWVLRYSMPLDSDKIGSGKKRYSVTKMIKIAEYNFGTGILTGRDELVDLSCLYVLNQTHFRKKPPSGIQERLETLDSRWPFGPLDRESICNMLRSSTKCTVLKQFMSTVIESKNCHLADIANRWSFDTLLMLAHYFDELDSLEGIANITGSDNLALHVRNMELFLDGDSKKLKGKVGIPVDIIQKLTEKCLTEYIPDIQRLFAQKASSPEDFRKLLNYFDTVEKLVRNKKFFKQTKKSEHDLVYAQARFQNDMCRMILQGVPAHKAIDILTRSVFLFTDNLFLCVPEEKSSGAMYLFRSLASTMYDTVSMQIASGRAPVLEQNIEEWHNIVARNLDISKEDVPGYEEMAAKLNEHSFEVDGYLIRCPQTVSELVDIGFAYKNCLPTYAEHVAEGKASIYAVYEDPSKMPAAVFEVGYNLEFIQIKTYFDRDVDDPAIIEAIGKWRNKIKQKNNSTVIATH